MPNWRLPAAGNNHTPAQAPSQRIYHWPGGIQQANRNARCSILDARWYHASGLPGARD